MLQLFRKSSLHTSDTLTRRHTPCSVCNTPDGLFIATTDYWDLQSSNLIQCPVCQHTQLDPMLNDEQTATGCYAYYIEESLRINETEHNKNCVRNFRRGIVFGLSLRKRKIKPNAVLEVGPGSGYFAAGLQFVFPDARITVMDINPTVLKNNNEQHGYTTIQGVPEKYIDTLTNTFDLIIARDVLEHVSDISAVLSNLVGYLKPHAYFHFITPNGHEDVWKHLLTYTYTQSPSELLINHVNYFDGAGLRHLLIQKGLQPIQYYTYNLKTTLRGRGWKFNKKLMAPVSKKTKAAQLIVDKAACLSATHSTKQDILNKWYITTNVRCLTWLYSLYQHYTLLRVRPEKNKGHEIHGLYKKIN